MSTSNEPSPIAAHETGKKRASRIALDYFKHGTYLDRWKHLLSGILLLLALGYGAYVLSADRRAVSRGPVASVHSAWDQNCQACHEDFSGVSVRRLWGGSAPHGASDAKCQACHEGTVHHNTANEASGVACGTCHRDHRGRDASLVRLGDSDCTSCHANLEANMAKDRKPSYHSDPNHAYPKTITTFADHPEFALPKSDPGNIKFNHAKHLKEGQEVGWTLGQIKADVPEAVKRFRDAPFQTKKEDTDLVQLDCASCHVLDPGDGGGKGTKAAGAYYQPISFEANCRACHALSFDAALKTTVKPPATTGPLKVLDQVQLFADFSGGPVPVQAPHRVQPRDLDAFLWGVYADAYLNKNAHFKKQLLEALQGTHQPTRPLPGKGAAAVKQSIDEQVAIAKETLGLGPTNQKQRILHNSCQKCHTFEDPATQQRVLPSNIPIVWQKHAKFNHVSHRAMECRSCHDKVDKAVTKDEVMLPDVKSCQECHAPARSKGGVVSGGVRADCTTCHAYHNGEHTDRGIGAAAQPERTAEK